MLRIRNVKGKLLATAAMAVYVALIYVSPITCPILAVTGIPCPGCGLTRACLAALRLDLAAAFSYHFMFWSVPVLYGCFWLDGRLFPRRWMNLTFYALLGAGFLVNWLRHFF